MFVRVNSKMMVNLLHVVGVVHDDKHDSMRLITDDNDQYVVENDFVEGVKSAMSKMNFYFTK